MPFWTSQTIRGKGATLVEPFHVAQLDTCAYELSLGPEAYVTGGEPGQKVFLTEEAPQLVIPPGQFALLLTEEFISIPLNTIGFISVKFSLKRRGLVNISGFHVDPGFHGRLIFSVYNSGGTEICISRGDPVFPLWIADLREQTDKPYGNGHSRQDQYEISNNDIMAIGARAEFSPAALSNRIDGINNHVNDVERRLEEHLQRIRNWGRTAIAIVGTLAAAAGAFAALYQVFVSS